jgi:hypothetical protein
MGKFLNKKVYSLLYLYKVQIRANLYHVMSCHVMSCYTNCVTYSCSFDMFDTFYVEGLALLHSVLVLGLLCILLFSFLLFSSLLFLSYFVYVWFVHVNCVCECAYLCISSLTATRGFYACLDMSRLYADICGFAWCGGDVSMLVWDVAVIA